MLYNAMERPHTRPSKFVDKGTRRKPRMQGRDTRGEVMTFSVDLPGFSDERGSMTPVYVADRCARPQQSWTQPMQRPVSALDTDRKRVPLIGREGVNLRLGMALILAALFALMLMAAVSYGRIIRLNYDVNTLRDKISDYGRQSEIIRQQIDTESSEISVTLSAVEMGMISARGVDVIYLTAPESAVMSNPGTGTLSAEYLGAVFGD